MINQKSKDLIRKAIKFKYNEHVSNLLTIPNTHLNKIVPNRGLPVTDILKCYNKDSGIELIRYGDEIKSEILRSLEMLKLSEFSEQDKRDILHIVDEYCKPELYFKRFELMLQSIVRKTSSYGLKMDFTKHRIDIPRSLCESYARNTTNSIRSKIENDLDYIIERLNAESNETESKVSDVTNCLELKPNLFGLGLNFNAIIDKIFKRKKT